MTTEHAWVQALTDPHMTVHWSLQDWQRVVRLSRRLRLLARLAEGVHTAGIEATLPVPVQQHLLAERRLSRFRLRTLAWTAEQVGHALEGCAYPCVLLKGAAYVAQGLPVAPGRLPSDLDVMVPRAALADAQRRLRTQGWAEIELDDHDRTYYADWSHEVPPMRHAQFGIELDLHHAILPPVARTTVDSELLFSRVQGSAWARWQVLCPVDQVLHSAAHLFLDSELRDRLRDLVDLDGMLRHFARHPEFWTDLVERSRELRLTEPLALAVNLLQHWLNTPVPEGVRRSIENLGPGALRRAILLPLFERVLTPTEPDASPSTAQRLAATTLLARYHLHRMPLRLLLPHLWHKAHRRSFREREGAETP